MGHHLRKRVSDNTRKRAISLRHEPTYPEKKLWSALSGRKLAGLKFRRQHPIEPYIVDFYCAQVKLILELDGESHDGRQEYDSNREHYLESMGLRVLRIANDDVLKNLDGVVEMIARVAGYAEATPSPSPSPAAGEGDEKHFAF